MNKAETQRSGFILVSPEFLANALRFPDDHEIVGVDWDFQWQGIRIYVDGPGMPEVKEGEVLQRLDPVFRRCEKTGTISLHSWGNPEDGA